MSVYGFEGETASSLWHMFSVSSGLLQDAWHSSNNFGKKMVQLLDLNFGSETNPHMSSPCLPGWWEINRQPQMLTWAGAQEPSFHSGLGTCILRQAEWRGGVCCEWPWGRVLLHWLGWVGRFELQFSPGSSDGKRICLHCRRPRFDP